MRVETIEWKILTIFTHHSVTYDLGDNASEGDGSVEVVSIDKVRNCPIISFFFS